MQTTKKKPSLIFILVGAVLAGYLGYLINGAWTEGIAFNEFMDRFNEVCAVPFANYYNSNTVKAVAIALGIYAMAIVMYYTSQRNYMPVRNLSVSRHCCLCQTALTICTNGFCYRYGWNPSPLKCGICQSSLLYTQGFQQLHTGQHSLLWQALHP